MVTNKELFSALKRSTVARTAALVLALTVINWLALDETSKYFDSQPPRYIQDGDRWRIEGPGFRLRQSQIDPTIVSVLKDGPFYYRDGFKRGRELLTRLCGDVRFSVIHEDPPRTMHVRIPDASRCLADPNKN